MFGEAEDYRLHRILVDGYPVTDGATVPVLYEGRTAEGAVKDGATLDGLFEEDAAANHPQGSG